MTPPRSPTNRLVVGPACAPAHRRPATARAERRDGPAVRGRPDRGRRRVRQPAEESCARRRGPPAGGRVGPDPVEPDAGGSQAAGQTRAACSTDTAGDGRGDAGAPSRRWTPARRGAGLCARLRRTTARRGAIKPTKTGQLRAVHLLKPLKDDLDLWRLTSTSTDDDLVFPTATGGPFRDHDRRNWRHRVYEPVAKAVGIERSRPYDLRHSFVSLLIHEGRSVVEVAAQAGHPPTMTLSTHAHVIAELEGGEHVPAGTQILAAQPRARSRFVARQAARTQARPRNPCTRESPLPDSNRRPLPYHGSALPTELRGRWETSA